MTKQELEKELAAANEKAAKLDKHVASLRTRREQLHADSETAMANYNAVLGAIQAVDFMLAELEK